MKEMFHLIEIKYRGRDLSRSLSVSLICGPGFDTVRLSVSYKNGVKIRSLLYCTPVILS
jgi:hypothetical protein